MISEERIKQLDAQMRAGRVENLASHRASNVVKTIEILFPYDDRTCQAVRKFDGIAIPLDDVPELPLPGCDAEYCRCVYVCADDLLSEDFDDA